MLEHEGEALRHRVVAQPPIREWLLPIDMREVLHVARLVEERSVVVVPAVRADHQVDLARDLHRRAERAWRLAGPLLRIKMHVGLLMHGHAQPLQRRLQRGQHPLAREVRVELRRTREPRQVAPLRRRRVDVDLPQLALQPAAIRRFRLSQKALDQAAQPL